MSSLISSLNFPVINFFGAPGAGKTTAALGLTYELKKRWVSAELIQEYAKDLVYSDSAHLLSHQHGVFAEQERRLNRVVGKAALAVSESPLLLSAYYSPEDYPISFKQSVFDFFLNYHNINIFVERSHAYSAIGRIQNEAESDAVAWSMRQFLRDNGIPFYSVTANDANPAYLVYWLAKAKLIKLGPDTKPFTEADIPPPNWITPSIEQQLDAQGLPIKPAAAVSQRYVPDGVRTKGDVASS